MMNITWPRLFQGIHLLARILVVFRMRSNVWDWWVDHDECDLKSSGPAAFSLTFLFPARIFAVFRRGSNGSAVMNVTCKSSEPTAPSTSFSKTFILLFLLF